MNRLLPVLATCDPCHESIADSLHISRDVLMAWERRDWVPSAELLGLLRKVAEEAVEER